MELLYHKMALNDIYYIKEKLKSEFWDFFSALGRRPRTWERSRYPPSRQDRGSDTDILPHRDPDILSLYGMTMYN